MHVPLNLHFLLTSAFRKDWSLMTTAFFTKDLVVMFTLAFGIQNAMNIFECQKQVISQHDSFLREGLAVVLTFAVIFIF